MLPVLSFPHPWGGIFLATGRIAGCTLHLPQCSKPCAVGRMVRPASIKTGSRVGVHSIFHLGLVSPQMHENHQRSSGPMFSSPGCGAMPRQAGLVHRLHSRHSARSRSQSVSCRPSIPRRLPILAFCSFRPIADTLGGEHNGGRCGACIGASRDLGRYRLSSGG